MATKITGTEYKRLAALNFSDEGVTLRNDEVQWIAQWEHMLKNLTTQQRTVFTAIVIVITALAVFENVLTVIINIKRKQRHLFRLCLLSLAFSDIIFVVVTSIIYLSQFNGEYNSFWTLGDLMCSVAPFLQTMAVLVNSITLVVIALDRYMAVTRFNNGSWEPSGIFCFICAVLIWSLAAGVSAPMATLYQIYNIILLMSEAVNPEAITGFLLAQVCGTEKSKNGYYFVIVFTVIFIPLLLAFLWLNSVIAKEIWVRRHPIQNRYSSPKKRQTSSSADNPSERKTTTTNIISERSIHSRNSQPTPAIFTTHSCTCTNCCDPFAPPKDAAPPPPPRATTVKMIDKTIISAADSSRKRRQLRMFKAIVCIMAVFFVCRLPTWIFLLIKLHGVANTNVFWVLHYTFGIMAMLNCMLNPLLYTFLNETIKFSAFLRTICIRTWLDPCRERMNGFRVKFWKWKTHSKQGNSTVTIRRTHRDGIFLGE
ncbi:alpha-2Db adrenergic receptor [Toxorhynchites rutilus septentrionalis]|uniref:alpha-2Db adrenergic receptor n=1 Tax=Toxorhynchites rutilus septentrionalis TaxID=329112 RepID=UPI0024785AF4|nr:alpha-2Db adrenergic receptor [Toxorhynchites rutilus septentrionalis]